MFETVERPPWNQRSSLDDLIFFLSIGNQIKGISTSKYGQILAFWLTCIADVPKTGDNWTPVGTTQSFLLVLTDWAVQSACQEELAHDEALSFFSSIKDKLMSFEDAHQGQIDTFRKISGRFSYELQELFEIIHRGDP